MFVMFLRGGERSVRSFPEDYDELRLRIDRRDRDAYHVHASTRSAEASGSFELPFNETEIENFILRVSRPRGRRRIQSSALGDAKRFGGGLFQALFRDRVYGLYHDAVAEARSRGRGLRLTLCLSGSPELIDVPWEYLFDDPDFLAVSAFTPVVRYLDLPRPYRPLQVEPPLRLLGVLSSPADYEQLDVERERDKLRRALSGLIEAGAVELRWLERSTLGELLRALQAHTFHGLHYIGHATFDKDADQGVLLFEDDSGWARPVSGEKLGMILHDFSSLRLAVLNACEGGRTARTDPFAGVAGSLVQRDVPAVIAMQFEISDEAAIVFAEGFYRAIASGSPVDAATAAARLAMLAERSDDIEWGTPVLFMRVPDGRIFDLRQRPTPLSGSSASEVDADSRGAAAAERSGARYMNSLSSTVPGEPTSADAADGSATTEAQVPAAARPPGRELVRDPPEAVATSPPEASGGVRRNYVRVFVSYRRDDVPDATDRLVASLIRCFGEDHVFLDADSVEIGAPFAEVIDAWVASCDVLLAVIGRGWVSATDDEGRRRLEDPADYVRLEIEAGLRKNIRVVPVLVHDTKMPRRTELPETLAPLVERSAIALSRTHWDLDTDRLAAALQRITRDATRPEAASGETADVDTGERPRPRHAAAQPAAPPEPEGEAADRPRAEHRRAAPKHAEGSSRAHRLRLALRARSEGLVRRRPRVAPSRRPWRARALLLAGALLATAAVVVVVLVAEGVIAPTSRKASRPSSPASGNAAGPSSLAGDVRQLNTLVQLFIMGHLLSNREDKYLAAAANRKLLLKKLAAFDPPPQLLGATQTLRQMTSDSLTFNLDMARGEVKQANIADEKHNALRSRFVSQFNRYAQRYLQVTYNILEL